MTKNTVISDRDFLVHAFKGNQAAADYVLMVAQVADVWDNLIDGDKPVSDQSINLAFWNLAVMIPRNPFYRAYINDLLPVTATGIANWMIANRYERNLADTHAVEIAHVLRYSIADVALMAATLIGGLAWVDEVGPELRLRAQRSDFKEYVDSLTAKEGASHV